MITAWQMYWLTRLDGISAMFVGACILGFGGAILCLPIWGGIRAETPCDEEPALDAKMKRIVATFVLIATLSGVIAVSIPTTKEMAVILVTPRIINNEKVQRIPDKLLDLANQKLDEWTKTKEGK